MESNAKGNQSSIQVGTHSIPLVVGSSPHKTPRSGEQWNARDKDEDEGSTEKDESEDDDSSVVSEGKDLRVSSFQTIIASA
jgi:hypothetical protein